MEQGTQEGGRNLKGGAEWRGRVGEQRQEDEGEYRCGHNSLNAPGANIFREKGFLDSPKVLGSSPTQSPVSFTSAAKPPAGFSLSSSVAQSHLSSQMRTAPREVLTFS